MPLFTVLGQDHEGIWCVFINLLEATSLLTARQFYPKCRVDPVTISYYEEGSQQFDPDGEYRGNLSSENEEFSQWILTQSPEDWEAYRSG